MRLSKRIALLFLLALALAPCRPPAEPSRRDATPAPPSPAPTAHTAGPSADSLRRDLAAVRRLHKPFGPVQPGDWVTHTPEPGQTFEQYLAADPVTADGPRRLIYVQPLGHFTPAQRRVVALASDFLSRFFSLPVRVLPDRTLEDVPATARRLHPTWGTPQIRSDYLWVNLLRPALPDDAAALIGFTAEDLYPNDDFNFVFGQASLVDRVGVWSLHRFGDPDAGPSAFRQTLRRTLKLAAHETGHMFSLPHCTAYDCVMCGTNHLAETDRRPVEACPECMAKICWATRAVPRERYARLAEFCRAEGLDAERRFYESLHQALAGN